MISEFEKNKKLIKKPFNSDSKIPITSMKECQFLGIEIVLFLSRIFESLDKNFEHVMEYQTTY